MKKIFLLLTVILSAHFSYAQHSIFMSLVENKVLCSEDRLVYFLEHNSFIRKSHTFYHQYAENGKIFNTMVTYDNACYAIYSTDNVKEYKRIVGELSEMSEIKHTATRREYYNCDNKRIHNVQLEFLGFQPQLNTYEIKIFQNPNWDEMSY